MKHLTGSLSNAESTARLVLLMTLAYTLLGAVGLKLAIPPGYASPVFPAAGLALACVLIFERKGALGIWLGSLLLNLSHAWLAGKLIELAPDMPEGYEFGQGHRHGSSHQVLAVVELKARA